MSSDKRLKNVSEVDIGALPVSIDVAALNSPTRRAYLVFRSFFLHFIILTMALIIALVIAELCLRIAIPQMPVTNTPQEFLAPNKIGYKPFSQWEVNEPEFRQYNAINSLGYRDQEIDLSKPTIVFLGDSQTFGTGVNFGQRVSDLIRAFLATVTPAKFNVLNVAMPGASTIDERRFLLDVINKGVNIERVYLVVSTNDHYANLHDQDDPESYDIVDPHYKKTPSLIRSFVKNYRYQSRLVQLVLQRLVQFSWFQNLYTGIKTDLGIGEFMSLKNFYLDQEAARQQLAATKNAVSKILALAPVTIVMVPDRYRVDPTLRRLASAELISVKTSMQSLDLEKESELMAQLAAELEIELIDANDFFATQENPGSLSYPINGHLTVSGQKLLASYIIEHSNFLNALSVR